MPTSEKSEPMGKQTIFINHLTRNIVKCYLYYRNNTRSFYILCVCLLSHISHKNRTQNVEAP